LKERRTQGEKNIKKKIRLKKTSIQGDKRKKGIGKAAKTKKKSKTEKGPNGVGSGKRGKSNRVGGARKQWDWHWRKNTGERVITRKN